MAQKIQTILISDLSGDEISNGGRTVPFSFNGVEYSIDLTDKEAAGFEKSIAMYIEHGQRVGGRKQRGTSNGAAPSGSGRSKEELADMRAWLRQKGHEVSDRGRISQELQDLYDKR